MRCIQTKVSSFTQRHKNPISISNFCGEIFFYARMTPSLKSLLNYRLFISVVPIISQMLTSVYWTHREHTDNICTGSIHIDYTTRKIVTKTTGLQL